MSFLNPVNEPVLRFKSTDAGAPQINYNARVAGDVKAVLKACLVTGYGATSSAGWSVVNEVNHVAEFVSPSAAMSDYRLGIDDTSTSSTTWYYQYQDVRVNPAYNTPVKALTFADKVSSSNGWQMLVTERGIILLELVQHSVVSKLSARITYWGAIKSGLPNVIGKNICFFNIGHDGAINQPNYFYSSLTHVHTMLEGNTSAFISAATSNALTDQRYALNTSNVDLVSSIYLSTSARDMLIGELPALLSRVVNNTADLYGVSDGVINNRTVFSVCAGLSNATINNVNSLARSFFINTDYWEY